MEGLIETAELQNNARLWGIAGVFRNQDDKRLFRFGGWFTQGGLLGGSITDGHLIDYFGQSRIEGNFHPEERMDFDKKYSNSQDKFHYTFIYQNGLWIGKYSAEDGEEKGNAVLFLFPVSFSDRVLV